MNLFSPRKLTSIVLELESKSKVLIELFLSELLSGEVVSVALVDEFGVSLPTAAPGPRNDRSRSDAGRGSVLLLSLDCASTGVDVAHLKQRFRVSNERGLPCTHTEVYF